MPNLLQMAGLSDVLVVATPAFLLSTEGFALLGHGF